MFIVLCLFRKFLSEIILLQPANGISLFILGCWFHGSNCQTKEKFLCCEGFVQISTPVPSKIWNAFFPKMIIKYFPCVFLNLWPINKHARRIFVLFKICPYAGDWFIFSFSRTSKISDIKMTWAIFAFIRIKFHLSQMVSNLLHW